MEGIHRSTRLYGEIILLLLYSIVISVYIPQHIHGYTYIHHVAILGGLGG